MIDIFCFFLNQKTAYEMRISDWSSDVCSSDLAPMIGYGAMLMEAFVAIMALVGASILDPGIYFTMNSPAAAIGTDAASAAAAVTAMGFPISPDLILQTEIGRAHV